MFISQFINFKVIVRTVDT